MDAMDQTCKLYESSTMRDATGPTIRPGGFTLTDSAFVACEFRAGAKILDVGCGSGATVSHLNRTHNAKAVGVDPSDFLLQLGRAQHPELELARGVGEALPFAAAVMDGVFAECTLSLMQDLKQTLREIHRVLRSDGWFVANDVYARNPAGAAALQCLSVSSCLRGAIGKDDILQLLQQSGFVLVSWEDHTDLLKQLMVQTIMQHGSMTEFWLKSSACTMDPVLAQTAMKQAKMGYYQLIARKN